MGKKTTTRNDATIVGGRGDDTYIVNDIGVVISESRNGGTDLVQASVDYTLGDWLENLELTGTDDLSGTGNTLNNSILGNDGANLLSGLEGDDILSGGGGDDTLLGGDGDDILSGDAGSDILDGGAGYDTALFSGVMSSYSIERQGDEIWVTRTIASGVTEVDRLTGIEVLSFQDFDLYAADIPPSEPSTPQPALIAPTATADFVTGNEDELIVIPVLANDLGEGLTITGIGTASQGTVYQDAQGNLLYRATANAFGSDSFDYQITDANGLSSMTTVSVDVLAVNDAPEAGADSFAVRGGSTFTSTVSLLANDTDPDNDALSISGYDATTSNGGTISLSQDGYLTYVAPSAFSGQDSFTYTIADGSGAGATGTVTLAVTADAPATTGDLVDQPYYVQGILDADVRQNAGDPFGTAVTVKFAFLDTVPDYYSADHWVRTEFASFDLTQRAATLAVLDQLSSFANITFEEVSSPTDADLTFGFAEMNGWNGLTTPAADGTGNLFNDVWLTISQADSTFDTGSAIYKTLIHEIGHTLGLDHVDRTLIPSVEDNRNFTVMSASGPVALGYEPSGFMSFDVAALQFLYGANTGYSAGATTYSFADLDGRLQTIWDAGGQDLFDLSDAGFGVRIDLAEGGFSTVESFGLDNLSIAYGAVIEDVTGSDFADILAGNDVANRIEGGGGNDTLSGGAAADTFAYGTNWGSDVILDFNSGEDLIDLSGSGLARQDIRTETTADGLILSSAHGSIFLEDVFGISDSDMIFDYM